MANPILRIRKRNGDLARPKAAELYASAVARVVIEFHERLTEVIEIRAPAEARRLIVEDHVKMIRARRRSNRCLAGPEARKNTQEVV